MERVARFIVNNRNKFGIIFVLLLIASLILIPMVRINYDLSEYIPNSERAKQGLNITKKEFGMQSYARVMLNDITLAEAKEIKDKIVKVDGVDSVLWLDNYVDVNEPIDFISDELLNDYYKDHSALLEVMFEEDEYSSRTNKAVGLIQKIIPENSNMIGAPVDTKSSQDTLVDQVVKIMIILVPVVIIILILTTNSYSSPFLFMVVIGTSILLNMGSNIIFTHVSFITYSIVAALQLAVSMDYSVFLLHEFENEDKTNILEAMTKALATSITAIFSSALTTIAGFVALAFMSFTIGRDMGLIFAKGIVLSLLTVILFMPFLIIKFYPLIKKGSHKSFLPNFDRFSNLMSRIAYLLITIVLVIAIPSYVAQKQNEFLYGSSSFGGGEGTKVYEDEKAIDKKFGKSNPVIILVPNGDYISEKEMGEEIENLKVVKKVQSFTNNVAEGIPDSFVPIDSYQKLKSNNYSRFIIYLKTDSESDMAFESVRELEEIAQKYYGDNYEITGVVPITMDIKEVINSDYNIVNLLSILSVTIILLFTFKSVALPIILTTVIELGIFINMAIPYFMGFSMMFIGYLIVSSIQLGATIDYAILLTNNYLEARKTKVKREASRIAVSKSLPSIITSGGILVVAAFLLKWCSTITAVSQMGELIGRGAIISILLVVFFLPHILVVFDKVIEFTFFKNIINRSKKRRKKLINKAEEIKDNGMKKIKAISKSTRKKNINSIRKERKKAEKEGK